MMSVETGAGLIVPVSLISSRIVLQDKGPFINKHKERIRASIPGIRFIRPLHSLWCFAKGKKRMAGSKVIYGPERFLPDRCNI